MSNFLSAATNSITGACLVASHRRKITKIQLLEIWKHFCKHWHVIRVKIVVVCDCGLKKKYQGNCADWWLFCDVWLMKCCKSEMHIDSYFQGWWKVCNDTEAILTAWMKMHVQWWRISFKCCMNGNTETNMLLKY